MLIRGVREFVARDWRAVRASKDAYWADRINTQGPVEALRIAGELRRQVRQQLANWPDDTERHQDLLFHVHFAEQLRRVGPTGRR